MTEISDALKAWRRAEEAYAAERERDWRLFVGWEGGEWQEIESTTALERLSSLRDEAQRKQEAYESLVNRP